MSRNHVGIWTKGFGYNYHNGSHGREGVDKDGISFFENLYGNGTMVFYGAFAK